MMLSEKELQIISDFFRKQSLLYGSAGLTVIFHAGRISRIEKSISESIKSEPQIK